MLVSTMIACSDIELEQMMRKETEECVALELVDPRENTYDSADTNAMPGDEQAENDRNVDPAATAEGALSNEERGNKLEVEHDDDDVVDTSSVQASGDKEEKGSIFDYTSEEQTFREDLHEQINVLDITEEERYLAHYLIDSLEEDGYLHRSLDELVDDLEFSQHYMTTVDDLEAVLVEIVQEELEPTGIAARNLRECLLLQAQELKATPANRLAYIIIDKAFDDLAEKRYDKIEERLGITSHRAMVDALRAIRHLNPKPGNMEPISPKTTANNQNLIRPDFFVLNEDGVLQVVLNDSQMLSVRISSDEQAIFESLQADTSNKGKDASVQEKREGVKFLRQNMQRAQTFIDCLEQRRTTMLTVMKTIVRMQRAYFLTGQIETLLPMTLEDVEQQCEYDKSTISRVTSEKYADTEFGIIPLKSLFTNAVGDTTQSAIVEALRQIIDDEDKRQPFTDDALVIELQKQGYNIARKTVQKYRDTILGLGTARQRREV